MLTVLVCFTASVPAFAPVPVARNTVTGDLLAVGIRDSTITLKCGGKEKLFKVARDAKVTMNGQEGYSLDDVGVADFSYRPIVTLRLEKGNARSLVVTLTLDEREKLWRPGMNSKQVKIREARERMLKLKEEIKEHLRQLEQGGP